MTTRCIHCYKVTSDKLFCQRCLDDDDLELRCPCGIVIPGPGGYCSTRCVCAFAPRQKIIVEADTLTFLANVASGTDEEGDDRETVVSTAAPKPMYKEMPHIAHTSVNMCCSCLSVAPGMCRCGRRVCGGCVDNETGLCPYCDDEAGEQEALYAGAEMG